jgi:hypothetical protein
MNTDNTQGGAEPSSASAGSHEKPAIETMTSQERFNSAVMGWISEATEAIEGSGAVSDSAKRLVDEMRCQCGDAYQAMFSRQATHPQPTLTDEEREAIQRAIDSHQHRAAEMHSRSWAASAIKNDCDTLRALLG